MKEDVIYLIASLRNDKVPEISNTIEKETGIEVFDSWFSPGPRADDHWKSYEIARGRTYEEALKHYAGTHIFEFDHHHIERATIGVLVMPAGKSGCLELGYMIGTGKPGLILMDKPDRWDVMMLFATLNGGGIFFNIEDLTKAIQKIKNA